MGCRSHNISRGSELSRRRFLPRIAASGLTRAQRPTVPEAATIDTLPPATLTVPRNSS